MSDQGDPDAVSPQVARSTAVVGHRTGRAESSTGPPGSAAQATQQPAMPKFSQRYEINLAARLISTMPGAAAYFVVGTGRSDRRHPPFPTSAQPGQLLGADSGSRNSGEATRMGSITAGEHAGPVLARSSCCTQAWDDVWMRTWFRAISRRRVRRSPEWP